MAEEKLWFSHTIEGLFVRGLGSRMTPEHLATLKAGGIDLAKLKPAYPVEDVFAVCRTLLPRLWPELSTFDAEVQLGICFMQGYTQTLMGGAMVKLMRLIGPRRSLERMQANFRGGGNYIETRFTSLGPTLVELWFNDTSGMPGFYLGVVEEGGRMVNAKNLKVTAVPDVPPASVLRVSWDA
jgi:uncharacterized protein (TIGR02265 family)